MTDSDDSKTDEQSTLQANGRALFLKAFNKNVEFVFDQLSVPFDLYQSLPNEIRIQAKHYWFSPDEEVEPNYSDFRESLGAALREFNLPDEWIIEAVFDLFLWWHNGIEGYDVDFWEGGDWTDRPLSGIAPQMGSYQEEINIRTIDLNFTIDGEFYFQTRSEIRKEVLTEINRVVRETVDQRLDTLQQLSKHKSVPRVLDPKHFEMLFGWQVLKRGRSEIAEAFNCSYDRVPHLLKEAAQRIGLSKRDGRGRPKKTKPQTDR